MRATIHAPSLPPRDRPHPLIGGGEMGDRIRSFDWAATPLGPAEEWPTALVTSLGLVLHARMPMWLGWGAECRFFYNDAYVQVLGGAKHPWALGRPAAEVWAEIWDVCGPLAEQVFTRAEAPYVEDVRLFMDRGGGFVEEVYYSFSYSPIVDDAGRVGGLFCPNTEVTAKLLHTRRLRTLSELSAKALLQRTTAAAQASAIETIARNSDDIPFAILYLQAEDGGQELVLAETAHVSPDRSPLAPRRLTMTPGAPWPYREVLADGRPRSVPVPAHGRLPLGPAGRPVRDAVVLPLVAPGYDRPFGVLVAGVNPTRRLDAEYLTFYELMAAQVANALQNARGAEQERRRLEALAELDRAKSTFFTNISHEFRTPLTLMIGPTEDALARPDPALRGEALEAVYRNELRLHKLVNALLDFSRLEAGRMPTEYRSVDLARYTTELASGFRSAIERAGLALEVDAPALAGPVQVDPGHWERIVLNLVSNALKFTFDGTIRVRLREHRGRIELTVEDTGIGIPQEELPRLFERFHRVENRRARTHEGSGIGLALIHDLVLLHGGEITVESEVGRGTTFCVSLPARPAAEPAQDVQPPLAFDVVEAERWATAASAAPPVDEDEYVLLADDNADMREYVHRLLSEHWAVLTVPDGLAAVQAATLRPPALVITDIMMPGLDGYGVLNALRSDPRTREVPVILLSARAGEEARVEGLDAGADDYLVKPFSARELVARVRTHVELGRARGQIARDYDDLFQLLMQVPPAILVRRGPELRCVFQNAASLAIGDLRGRSLRETWPHAPWLEIEEDVYRTGSTRHARELTDGQNHWDVTWAPLCAPDGAIDGVVTVATDVTDRVAARHDGALAHERLRAAVEASAIGTYRWSVPDGRVDADDGVRRLFGLAAGAGNHLDEYTARIHPDDRSAWLAGAAAVRAGAELSLEYRVVQDDGAVRWLLDKGQIVHRDDGVPLWVAGAIVDITEQKRLELAAREASRAKDEFLAVLGHELRNPLAPIATALHLLRVQDTSGSTPREIEVIERQVRHLTRLVDDLLDISRVTRGLVELKTEVVPLAEVLAKAMELASPLIERHHHHVALAASPDLWVLADPVRLAQVFSNLLTNAARYTPDGGHIAVEATAGDDGIAVTVSDDGRGIPREQLARIFELFVRGSEHTAGGEGGLGIGLALSRSLVRLHGGEIEAESDGPDRGARFTVRLPRAEARTGDAAEGGPLIAAAAGKRVLLVDDNLDAAEMLRMLLEQLGYRVAVAHDGPQALTVAASVRPDLAILDIGLPVMDGYELARRLRAAGAVSGRIIALTGYGQDQDRARAQRAGFDHHFVKPVDLDELVRALRG